MKVGRHCPRAHRLRQTRSRPNRTHRMSHRSDPTVRRPGDRATSLAWGRAAARWPAGGVSRRWGGKSFRTRLSVVRGAQRAQKGDGANGRKRCERPGWLRPRPAVSRGGGAARGQSFLPRELLAAPRGAPGTGRTTWKKRGWTPAREEQSGASRNCPEEKLRLKSQ